MSLHRRILLSPYPNGPDVPWSSPLPDLAPPALSARHLSNAAIASVSAAVAAAFLALVYYSVLHRRRRRRGDYPAGSVGGDDTASNSDGGDASDDYHVWNIQTFGLDESAIASIGSYGYLPGGGGNLTADCPVCLGQFEGGEMVRLLPKCGHVFHVPCIDTWLKAHVSCPLCRALVLSPEEDPGRVPAALEEEGEGGSETRVRVLADPDAPPEAEEAPEIPMDRSADTEREERSGEERKEENLGEREVGVSSSSGSGRGFFVKLGRGRSSSVLPFPS